MIPHSLSIYISPTNVNTKCKYLKCRPITLSSINLFQEYIPSKSILLKCKSPSVNPRYECILSRVNPQVHVQVYIHNVYLSSVYPKCKYPKCIFLKCISSEVYTPSVYPPCILPSVNTPCIFSSSVYLKV